MEPMDQLSAGLRSSLFLPKHSHQISILETVMRRTVPSFCVGSSPRRNSRRWYKSILAQFSGRSILFNNEYECRIYTLAGELTYDGPLSGTIVKVVSTGGSGLVQVGGQVMKKLTLR